jgi:hypothetical protein
MSTESVADSGERFARDLRRIREYRDVSIDEIHEETRIARTLVETFERGEIYDHPGFNRVYLRSFIRAYAGCVDVDPKRALAALDAVMEGDYTNELAAAYLADAPDADPSDSVTELFGDAEDEEESAAGTDDPAAGTGSGRPEEDAGTESASSDASGGVQGGDGAVDDDSPYSTRLNRPMGGTAAANDDLSSVSKPKPISREQADRERAGDDDAPAPADSEPHEERVDGAEEESAQETPEAGSKDAGSEEAGSESSGEPGSSGGAEENLPSWMKTSRTEGDSGQTSRPIQTGNQTGNQTGETGSRSRKDTSRKDTSRNDPSPEDAPQESTSSGDVGASGNASGDDAPPEFQRGEDAGGTVHSKMGGDMISEARPIQDDDTADTSDPDTSDTDASPEPSSDRAEDLTAEEAVARSTGDETGEGAGEEDVAEDAVSPGADLDAPESEAPESDESEPADADDASGKPAWFRSHDEDELTGVDDEAGGEPEAGTASEAAAPETEWEEDADGRDGETWPGADAGDDEESPDPEPVPESGIVESSVTEVGDEPPEDQPSAKEASPEDPTAEDTTTEEATTEEATAEEASADDVSGDDAFDDGSDEDGRDVHPLMQDPSEMDVEEEDDEPRPPDLQPHEDPNSEIGPKVDDGQEAPSWLGSENPGTTASAGSSDAAYEEARAEGTEGSRSAGRRGDVGAPPNPLVTLARQRTTGLIASGVAAVLVIGALIAWGMGAFGGGEGGGDGMTAGPSAGTADTTAATAASDTASAETEAPDRPPPATLTLDETLHLTVVAENDVTGIKLQRDDDYRRPYWIEGGEATVFPFSERVIVEREWENVDRILLEGYPYPLTERDAAGRLVITREDAQAFADTLRGSPAGLDVEPDTSLIPPPGQREPVEEEESAEEDTSAVGE